MQENRTGNASGRKTSPGRKRSASDAPKRRSAGKLPGLRKKPSARRGAADRAERIRKIKLAAIVVSAAAAALVIIYSVIAAGYRHRFLPNTHVNGFDVGRLSVADTEEILKKSVENYRLELAFRGGLNEMITSSDIGLTYVSSNEVETLMAEQKRMSWLPCLFGKKNYYSVHTSFHYDSGVLRSYLESLPEFDENYITSPRNSSVVLDADDTFRVSTEFQGNQPNEEVIFRAVDEAVNSSTKRLSLTSVPDAYAAPSVTSEDSDLKERADWLNNYLNTSVTIRYRDGATDTIDRPVLASWAKKDDDGLYYLDDDTVYMNIYRMVEAAAQKYDETYDTLDFQSTNHGTVTLKCSTPYGYKINVDSQTEKIFTKVYAHEQAEYEIENSVRATAEEKVGDTYVEVDITNQHLYYYMDGKLFIESDFVSGLESDPDRRTPSGVFAIFNLAEDQTLGSLTAVDEEQRYQSHVDYWMPFYESYGMHDASWRDSFGGDIYLWAGSHGCVNLPPENAKKIFQNLDVWTPVIVCRESDRADSSGVESEAAS